MSIIVTGAAGSLGAHVVTALLQHVSASNLILVSRSPEKLGTHAAAGATIRYGNFSEPESLPAAFEGGTRALIISTMPPGAERVQQHRNAFEAAERAGVRHLVYTSYPNPIKANPAPPVASHRLSEKDLRRVAVPWTILRNALFSDWRVLLARRYIADGQWTTNIGGGAHAYVARIDCAAAAAGVLIAPETQHASRTYELTGPALIGAMDIHSLLQEFAGRPIRCVQTTDEAYEAYRRRFEADPKNAALFELWTATGQAIREGYLSQLTTCARDLTGMEPTSLRKLFEQHRSGL
jgi:NAD(P)H dehydrogenase (quinone)